jgi:hypothetical protein
VVVLVAGLVGLGISNASAAGQAVGPYTIEGTVPDVFNPALQAIDDAHGSVKELGPLNASTTKIGVIHDDAVPTLGLTNPNAQVDLNKVWLDLRRHTDGNDYLYFAWQRDSNSGSGFIAYEFMQLAADDECEYDPAVEADLIAGCNPFANRSDGDFMILWDQQGGSKALTLRTWSEDANGKLVLSTGTTLVPGVNSAAEYSGDGYKGEAAINMTHYGLSSTSDCTTIANTVPSTVTGNSDTADYKDTVLTEKQLSSCGGLSIQKYIDKNANGSLNVSTPAVAADDITSGTDVQGYGFTVKNSGGTTVCSGTTSNTGALSCSSPAGASLGSLQAGTYTITETSYPSGATATVNTDPGNGVAAPNRGAVAIPGTTPINKTQTVTVGATAATVYFGNTCTSSAARTVTNVPNPTPSGFYVWYRISAGPGNSATTETNISGTGIVRSGTGDANVTATVTGLLATNSLVWGYGINSTKSGVSSTKALSGATYPGCAASDSVVFATGTISATKFKDANHDGVQSGTLEVGLAGFPFQLKDSGGTVIAMTNSTSTGAVQFSQVNPGTYTLHELQASESPVTFNSVTYTRPAGWAQSAPVSGGTPGNYSVTVGVAGGTVTTGTATGDSSTSTMKFGNTPLSNIGVTFASQTTTTPASSKGSISCTNSAGTVVGSGTGTAGDATPYSATGLLTGTYTCTVVITDP